MFLFVLIIFVLILNIIALIISVNHNRVTIAVLMAICLIVNAVSLVNAVHLI